MRRRRTTVTSSLNICPNISWEICFCCFERGVTSPAQTSFLQLVYGQIFDDDVTVQSYPWLFSSCFFPVLWIRIISLWCGSGFDLSPWCGPDDSDFLLMRIRIRLFTQMRIRIRVQIIASKKCSNPWKSAKIGSFHTFWLDICKLMRIRIRFRMKLINLDADPHFFWRGCGSECGSRLPKWCGSLRIQIRIHNTAVFSNEKQDIKRRSWDPPSPPPLPPSPSPRGQTG